MRRKPEILAPAGDMEKLQMAVLYGADAVYLAGTSFGMRSFAGNFTPEELPKAVKFAHDHGVRVHVTVNTMPRNDEVARLPEHLERLNDAGVDALILADLGAFTLAGIFSKDRFCGKNVLYLVLFMQCFYYINCVTNQYKRDAVWMEFFSKEKLGWQHLKN